MEKERPTGGTRATIIRLERSPFHNNPADTPISPAKRAVKIALFALISLSVFGLMIFNPPPFLFFNVSKSAPLGLYLRKNVTRSLEKGSFSALCLPLPIAKVALSKRYLIYIKQSTCPGHAPMVLKRIAAVSSDRIDLRQSGVRINGTIIPGSGFKNRDSRGRLLPHFPTGSYRVSSGFIWLLGENLKVSWDSRYYGPVPESSVQFSVRPLLTWR